MHQRLILFRLAAVLGGLGVVLVVIMEGFLHPQRAHPNDSPAAFREYAAAGSFTSIHIGDFVGTLCIVLALVALYRSLAHQDGWPRAYATIGVLTAVVVAAVFTVQMAVDGVALKSAVDDWVAAPAAEKPTAFRVANGIRDVEKGLSGSRSAVRTCRRRSRSPCGPWPSLRRSSCSSLWRQSAAPPGPRLGSGIG